MRILFEALDRKKGMTLNELITNFEKAKNLATQSQFDEPIKLTYNFNGTVKSFEIEAV